MDPKGRFSIEDHIWRILTQSDKWPFDPNFFDRAIRSAHPVEKDDFINGMRGSDCSIKKKKLKPNRISHHPRKHTITPCNSSYAGLTSTAAAAAAAAAAHSESAWHILFSALLEHVFVIRWQQCMLLMTFLQHRCCCYSRFGAFQRVPTRQLRR